MSDYEPNSAITITFKEAYGTTTYINTDFTKQLFVDGVSSAQTVTVTNVTGDIYKVSFTPNAAGVWDVHVYPTAAATVKYWERLRVVVDKARRYAANKLVVASGAYTLYDDDGTTIYTTGTTTASDGSRIPS